MAESQYFASEPTTPLVRERFTCTVWDRRLELVSAGGVYSRGHLDHGTAVLLREIEPPTSGRILDLGCGYGVIGVAIALASPSTSVLGVDVNTRAVLLSNENAVSLGVADRFTAVTPDQVDPEATYDEIWSNPPIHIGKPALHALLLEWLPRLAPGGRAVLVVGKNLGSDSLQRWLIEQGWPTTRLASAKGFRVLEVTTPIRP